MLIHFFLEHTEKLFKKYNLLMVSDIFKYKILILFYTINNSLSPSYLTKLVSWNSSSINYRHLRSSRYPLRNHYAGSSLADKCVRSSLPLIINGTDANILEAVNNSSLENYKHQVKKYLINKYSSADCHLGNCYSCRLRSRFSS